MNSNNEVHLDNEGNPLPVSGIWTSILHYCEYQERCHSEVRNKLYELGCVTQDIELHLAKLIENGVLNEERFAKAFAGGRFRVKQWGREKIRQQLRLRKISEYCIKKALLELDEVEYEKALSKLAYKKTAELAKERNRIAAKAKLFRYLVQKGYEVDLVKNVLNEFLKK